MPVPSELPQDKDREASCHCPRNSTQNKQHRDPRDTQGKALPTLPLREWQQGWDFSLAWVGGQPRVARWALTAGRRGLVLLYLCDNTALLTLQVLNHEQELDQGYLNLSL